MTAPTEDLIARLEQWPNHKTGADYSLAQVQDQQKEAAQALRALQQEVERLRGALEPFSTAADFWDAAYDDAEIMKVQPQFVELWRKSHGRRPWPQFVNADLRRARSALTGSAQG